MIVRQSPRERTREVNDIGTANCMVYSIMSANPDNLGFTISDLAARPTPLSRDCPGSQKVRVREFGWTRRGENSEQRNDFVRD